MSSISFEDFLASVTLALNGRGETTMVPDPNSKDRLILSSQKDDNLKKAMEVLSERPHFFRDVIEVRALFNEIIEKRLWLHPRMEIRDEVCKAIGKIASAKLIENDKIDDKEKLAMALTIINYTYEDGPSQYPMWAKHLQIWVGQFK